MKRKGIILLSSILAGSLLVGGAFAAYAVTDNADPFGINVTPGNLDEDTTKYVTLTWGEETDLQGVGLIKPGENRKVGVVSLASTKAYTGLFTLTMDDKTSLRDNDDYMFDHLEVYVYAGDQNLRKAQEQDEKPTLLPDEPIVKSITKGEQTVRNPRTRTLSFEAAGSSTGTIYSIFVSLKDSAASGFTSMTNDKVRIEVEWGVKDPEELKTTKTVYFHNTGDWSKVKLYAWKDSTVNAAWPGVDMVKEYTATDNHDVYTIEVPKDLTTLQFNDGTDAHKIDLISYTGYNAEAEDPVVCYVPNTGWSAKPSGKVVATLVGTLTREEADPVSLAEYKQAEAGDGNREKYIVPGLLAGDKIAFKEGNTTLHFFHWNEAEAKAVDDGVVYNVTADGEYTFFINNDNEIYVESNVAVSYYLVGKINGVDDWAGLTRKLTANSTTQGEYYIQNVTLKKDDGIKVMTGMSDYFPAGNANEYVVAADGAYDIYFRPDGLGDENYWHLGYLYVTAHVTE